MLAAANPGHPAYRRGWTSPREATGSEPSETPYPHPRMGELTSNGWGSPVRITSHGGYVPVTPSTSTPWSEDGDGWDYYSTESGSWSTDPEDRLTEAGAPNGHGQLPMFVWGPDVEHAIAMGDWSTVDYVSSLEGAKLGESKSRGIYDSVRTEGIREPVAVWVPGTYPFGGDRPAHGNGHHRSAVAADLGVWVPVVWGTSTWTTPDTVSDDPGAETLSTWLRRDLDGTRHLWGLDAVAHRERKR